MPVRNFVVTDVSATHKEFRSDAGYMQAQVDSAGKFAPTLLATPTKSASVWIDAANPRIVLRGKSALHLTPKGFAVGNGAVSSGYTKAGLARISKVLLTDERLRRSMLDLRRAWFHLTAEFAAASGLLPMPKIGTQFIAASRSRGKLAKRPRLMKCTQEEVTTVVTTEIFGWVNSVFTAAEQADKCVRKCADTHHNDPVGYGVCITGCGIGAFQDIVSKTWQVVDTITETIVEYETHCQPWAVPTVWFPSPWGAFDLSILTLAAPKPAKTFKPSEIQKAIKPFGDAIKCFLNADWKVTKVKDLAGIPGIGEVPVAVTVCVDRACLNSLETAFASGSFVDIIISLVIIIQQGGLDAVVVALSLGLTGVAGQVVAAVLILLAAHALIVAGELVVEDGLGLLANGACFSWPFLPAGLGLIANPVLAFEIAANTPVIVTPR